MLEELKECVYRANMRLKDEGLVVLTWGNASGLDRTSGLVVIKPSGVAYASLKPSDLVVVDLEGKIVEGDFRPSSDLRTHLELYRHFPSVGGIVHTHSSEATSWAQARREIRCYGTTHADCFHGAVPLTRFLTAKEVEGDYEGNTGKVIVETFGDTDPLTCPGILVAGHGPFTWGSDVMKAVDNAVSLEEIARMARQTEEIAGRSEVDALPDFIRAKHFMRKHGPNAYYGQKGRI